MQRVHTSTAATSKPPYSATGTPGYFLKGDPLAGTPATVPGPEFFNMVQEELLAVIIAAGMTPSPTDDTQLRAAILTLIEAYAPDITLASEAEAIAGTDAANLITPATLAAAIIGTVRGYTRQQRPVPVLRPGASGHQAIDLHLHQALYTIATGALILDNPTHMEDEAGHVHRIYSETPQTISYASLWKGSSLVPLPTITVAGKWLSLAFDCVDGKMLFAGSYVEG